MKYQQLPGRFILITFCLVVISLSITFQAAHSQTKTPLSLAKVLTGLQSQSGDFTLAEKNDFITSKVIENGVTFRLTPEIEKELINAGASSSLIRAIRLSQTKVTATPRPISSNNSARSAKYESISIEQNILENGVNGIKIFSTFTVYNMKDVESDIVYRFRKNGQLLKGSTTEYKTVTGHLSARRLLKPAHTAAYFEDLSTFLPYTEFNLTPGVHNLKMETAVITRDGKLIKQFPTQDLRIVIPGPKPKGSATLGRMWVDYDVKEKGILGMRVHVRMTLRDMKGETALLRVLFTKEDGTTLKGRTTQYRTRSGQTAIFRRLNPQNPTSFYRDIQMFIPYSEFGLSRGKYNLKMHADVITATDFQTISHLTYKSFRYTKR